MSSRGPRRNGASGMCRIFSRTVKELGLSNLEKTHERARDERPTGPTYRHKDTGIEEQHKHEPAALKHEPDTIMHEPPTVTHESSVTGSNVTGSRKIYDKGFSKPAKRSAKFPSTSDKNNVKSEKKKGTYRRTSHSNTRDCDSEEVTEKTASVDLSLEKSDNKCLPKLSNSPHVDKEARKKWPECKTKVDNENNVDEGKEKVDVVDGGKEDWTSELTDYSPLSPTVIVDQSRVNDRDIETTIRIKNKDLKDKVKTDNKDKESKDDISNNSDQSDFRCLQKVLNNSVHKDMYEIPSEQQLHKGGKIDTGSKCSKNPVQAVLDADESIIDLQMSDIKDSSAISSVNGTNSTEGGTSKAKIDTEDDKLNTIEDITRNQAAENVKIGCEIDKAETKINDNKVGNDPGVTHVDKEKQGRMKMTKSLKERDRVGGNILIKSGKHDSGTVKGKSDFHDGGTAKEESGKYDCGTVKGKSDKHDCGMVKDKSDKHGSGMARDKSDKHDKGTVKPDKQDSGTANDKSDKHDNGTSRDIRYIKVSTSPRFDRKEQRIDNISDYRRDRGRCDGYRDSYRYRDARVERRGRGFGKVHGLPSRQYEHHRPYSQRSPPSLYKSKAFSPETPPRFCKSNLKSGGRLTDRKGFNVPSQSDKLAERNGTGKVNLKAENEVKGLNETKASKNASAVNMSEELWITDDTPIVINDKNVVNNVNGGIVEPEDGLKVDSENPCEIKGEVKDNNEAVYGGECWESFYEDSEMIGSDNIDESGDLTTEKMTPSKPYLPPPPPTADDSLLDCPASPEYNHAHEIPVGNDVLEDCTSMLDDTVLRHVASQEFDRPVCFDIAREHDKEELDVKETDIKVDVDHNVVDIKKGEINHVDESVAKEAKRKLSNTSCDKNVTEMEGVKKVEGNDDTKSVTCDNVTKNKMSGKFDDGIEAKVSQIPALASSSSERVYTWLNSKISDDNLSTSSKILKDDLTNDDLAAFDKDSLSSIYSLQSCRREECGDRARDGMKGKSKTYEITAADGKSSVDSCGRLDPTNVSLDPAQGQGEMHRAAEGMWESWYPEYNSCYPRSLQEYEYYQWYYQQQAWDWYYQQQQMLHSAYDMYYNTRGADECNEHSYPYNQKVSAYDKRFVDDSGKMKVKREIRTPEKNNGKGQDLLKMTSRSKHSDENNTGAAFRYSGRGELHGHATSKQSSHMKDNVDQVHSKQVSSHETVKQHVTDNHGTDKRHFEEESILDTADTPECDHTGQSTTGQRHCTCRQENVRYLVLRACNCSAGNPPRVETFPSMPCLSSLDLGYNSCDSIDRDVSGIQSKLNSWYPFCSTPVVIDGPSQSHTTANKHNQQQPQDITGPSQHASEALNDITQQPTGEPLPDCLVKSAAHFAQAITDLHKAGLSERSLDMALNKVGKTLRQLAESSDLVLVDAGLEIGKDVGELDKDGAGSEKFVGNAETMKDGKDLAKHSHSVVKRGILKKGFKDFPDFNNSADASISDVCTGSSIEGYVVNSQDSRPDKDQLLMDKIKQTTDKMAKSQAAKDTDDDEIEPGEIIEENEFMSEEKYPVHVPPTQYPGARCRFNMFSQAQSAYRAREAGIQQPSMMRSPNLAFPPPPFPYDPRFPELSCPPNSPYYRSPPHGFCAPLLLRPRPLPPPSFLYRGQYTIPPPGHTRAAGWMDENLTSNKTSSSPDHLQRNKNQHLEGREKSINGHVTMDTKETSEPLEPTLKHKGLCRLKLVSYNSSDDSSNSDPDIQPFSMESLENSKALTDGSDFKQTPKKFKVNTDTDEKLFADKNMPVVKQEIRNSTRGAMRFSRTAGKKLKPMTDNKVSYKPPPLNHKEPSNTVTETVKPTKSRTLSEIVAGRNSTGEGTMRSPLGTGTLSPLPPFPASPFWGLYMPGNSSALTGQSTPDPERVLAHTSEYKYGQRFNSRYSCSPGISRDSDSDSMATDRSRWRTDFKRFHSYGVKYIDTHCHLDFLFKRLPFNGSFADYIEENAEIFPDEFEGCVAVFCNPATFKTTGLWLELAKEDNVWIAMGCHPKMATEFTELAKAGLQQCLKHPKCIALGEIGLDYSGTFRRHEEVQKRVFRYQLELAIKMRKPLVIHCRDADDDCLEIMKEIVPQRYKIHCHCFTSFWDTAKLWLEAFPNLYIGVTPLVTYRTADKTHDLARHIPLDRLLLETDTPYFIPRGIPRDDLRLSSPGFAITVAKEIAQYQEVPVSKVLKQCRINTQFVYGI